MNAVTQHPKPSLPARRRLLHHGVTALALAAAMLPALAQPDISRPNIVVIMVDDVAPHDISAIHRGLGAVKTPAIDRIATEGMTISDYYAQPSCTAGRAAFITGQYPIRTGLTSVGQPASRIGLSAQDATLADLLKARGYATGQFGKSHVGDRNEFLPTVHGFDEFFGILYHLNLMSMPEQAEFPRNPAFPGRPRNVIYSRATNSEDATVDPRWGVVGNQVVEDRGALGSERMKTFDDEVTKAALDWMGKARSAGKPYFLWFNPTRMHQPIHEGKNWKGKSGHGDYADGLLHLDNLVGQVLQAIDESGEAENTIVLFTSDNGVNLQHWPQAGSAAFRGEKGTTWDGGFRVPMFVRWPGKVPANSWSGEFMTSEDWLPTLMAAVGDSTVKEKLLKGMDVGGKTIKLHLDGYDQTEIITAKGKSKRREFFYYAESELTAIRVNHWKAHLAVKNKWLGEAEKIPGGLLIDIKLDPFERSPESAGHFLWMKEKSWLLPVFARPYLEYQRSLKDFPPRQSGAGVGAATLMRSD